ncbi:MAG: MFS transporter [Chloroflexi bacterium]|nr:MFS transporter [Chloroflexota bacterium]
MTLPQTLRRVWRRVERNAAGDLAPGARAALRVELAGGMLYGLLNAAAQFVPVVVRRLGGGPELIASYGAVGYISLIMAGPLVFSLRPRRALRFVVLCWVASRGLFLLTGLNASLDGFLLAVLGFALIEYIPGPAYARIVQRLYPPDQRGRVMALVRFGMALAMVCVAPLMGGLLDLGGPQALYPLAGLAGIGAALVYSRLPVDERTVSFERASALSFIWRIPQRDHRYALHLLGMIMFGIGGLMPSSLYPLMQVDRLHLSYTDLGILGLAQSAFWMLSYPYWGRQIDRRGGPYVLAISAALSAIVPLNYIWASNAWTLIPAFVASGLIAAGTDIGFLNAAIQLAEPSRVAEYVATQSLLMGVRGIVGLYVGVFLHAMGVPPEPIFVIGAALSIVALVMFRTVGRMTNTTSVGAGL